MEGRRVALVIGNGAYQNAPGLPNPANDATAVAEALRGLGFDVMAATDLDQPDMLSKLDEFSGRLDGTEVGLFYYAGHGLQVAGENYLVPVDARLKREAQVRLQTVPLETVLAAMESAVPTRLVLLDACRDNPLAQALKRGMGASRSSAVGQGLAEIRTGVGTLIAYATGPGDVASDGDGPHSPFTTALLANIATPGLEVRQVLGRVRTAVLDATGERQVPWDSSSLRGEFYFKPAEPEPEPIVAALPSAPTTTPGAAEHSGGGFDERQIDLGFWESIRESRKAVDFEAYLASFPYGIFAALARNRLEDLRHSGQTVASTPAPIEATPPPAQGPLPAPVTAPAGNVVPAPKPHPAGEQAETTIAALPAPARAVAVPSPADAEAKLGLSSDDWRALQQAMTALGFDTRGVDGKPGPSTRKAVAGWQQSKQVEATGFIGPLQRELVLSEAQPKLAALEATRSAPMVAQSPSPVAPAQPAASQPVTTSRKAGTVFRDCPDCPEMVVIPPGSFTMGSPWGEAGRNANEGPQRHVTFREPLAIGRYEVTFAQWDACVSAGGCDGYKPDDVRWGRGLRPVIYVSWDDTLKFVSWLRDKTGEAYRLPSEAEWEYAARAGTISSFWMGPTISRRFAPAGTDRRRTVAVDEASFPANPFGLSHVHGNVWEWVQDCYTDNYVGASMDGYQAKGKNDCRANVLRGGSWNDSPSALRSASRVSAAPNARHNTIGFRVARRLTP